MSDRSALFAFLERPLSEADLFAWFRALEGFEAGAACGAWEAVLWEHLFDWDLERAGDPRPRAAALAFGAWLRDPSAARAAAAEAAGAESRAAYQESLQVELDWVRALGLSYSSTPWASGVPRVARLAAELCEAASSGRVVADTLLTTIQPMVSPYRSLGSLCLASLRPARLTIELARGGARAAATEDLPQVNPSAWDRRAEVARERLETLGVPHDDQPMRALASALGYEGWNSPAPRPPQAAELEAWSRRVAELGQVAALRFAQAAALRACDYWEPGLALAPELSSAPPARLEEILDTACEAMAEREGARDAQGAGAGEALALAAEAALEEGERAQDAAVNAVLAAGRVVTPPRVVIAVWGQLVPWIRGVDPFRFHLGDYDGGRRPWGLWGNAWTTA